MPIKYIPYFPNTIEGQALLDNFVRTRRVLRYRDNNKIHNQIKRGLPLYEVETVETVRSSNKEGAVENFLIRGECLSACAWLKYKGIKVDLVYIDPPFASGADYAKKIFIRRNPKLADKFEKAEEQMEIEELRAFEEKMYGDIWNKESYLNWMYENLMAIKSIMSDHGSIFMHLDWHIGHYVKILMDEVFGEDNFKNEIIWCYSGGAIPNDRFPKKHDVIYWYSKTDEWLYQPIFKEYSEKTQQRGRTQIKGDNAKLREEGTPINDWWTDIAPVTSPTDFEKMYYTTQKPEALLDRVIRASSDDSDNKVVADFFGGSGVTSKVANDLGRRFIHVDIGINSLQTTRDRLKSVDADFDCLEIKDGVSLYRNPIQTMDKLKSLITGLRNEESLDNFWCGALQNSKLGLVPVYLPNLLDHSTKVLDIPLMNRILNEAMPELPDSVRQVIVYYIDIDDRKELDKFIDDNNPTEMKVELRDLKIVLSDVVVDDIVDFDLSKTAGDWKIEIKSFTSDRLLQKIDEYNQKKALNGAKKQLLDDAEEEEAEEENDNEEAATPNKKFKPIVISEEGLELIEFISLDCTNSKGIWKSATEIKIDKNGYVIRGGKKTKEFWDGTINCKSRPLRMKVRNIAGDEVIVSIQ